MVATSLGLYWFSGSLIVVASVLLLSYIYMVYKIKYSYEPFKDNYCIFQGKVNYLDCGKTKNETYRA